MKIRDFTTLLLLMLLGSSPIYVNAQTEPQEVVISGTRFTKVLFERWVFEYQKIYPDARFRFEDKGAAEFSSADIIVHGNAIDKQPLDKGSTFYTIANYAILPIANVHSPFADAYGKRGLTNEQIRQVFFYDPIAGDRKNALKVPFNVYTRVQQAPAPTAFAAKFGYSQVDLHGRGIVGADVHLITAVLRDSLGVTYCPVPLIYAPETGRFLEGIIVIPVDFDGNGKVSDDERFYDELGSVLSKLSGEPSQNVPIAEVKVSLAGSDAKAETVRFIKWVLDQGQKVLEEYGYLKPEAKVSQN